MLDRLLALEQRLDALTTIPDPRLLSAVELRARIDAIPALQAEAARTLAPWEGADGYSVRQALAFGARVMLSCTGEIWQLTVEARHVPGVGTVRVPIRRPESDIEGVRAFADLVLTGMGFRVENG